MKNGIFFILGFTIAIFASALIHDVHAIGIEVRDEKGQLVSSVGDSPFRNTFEFGIWAFPLITINLILLAMGIMHYKEKLPDPIKKSIRFIFNFEVSTRIAYAVVIGLLAIYIGFTINEIEYSKEVSWGDYPGNKQSFLEFNISDTSNGIPSSRYLLLSISANILGNIRIIPFIASISLLVLTYFFTVKITQKRFSGIVAMVLILQSHLFLEYDETATYENFWTLFYLLSLYLIYKKWYLSPLSFILSALAKPLTILFLPMTFMFIYDSDLQRKKKILITISYVAIIFLILVIRFGLVKGIIVFDYDVFITGFKALELFLRFDGMIIVFLLPLVIGLFLASRKGVLHANSVIFLIFGILISAPILAGFTIITNQPYRFVPLVVFFAIGVGILLSKRISLHIQNQKGKTILQYTIFLVTLATVSLNLMTVIFPKLITGTFRLSL